MNKLFTLLKSRFFLSAFVIILEFVQLLVVFILLSKYSLVISFLGYIFYIGVFLYIINKYESPEFKLPWIIIIMLFFVVGAFAFILLTSNEQNKKSLQQFEKNKADIKSCLTDDDTLSILQKENPDAYLQANYLCKVTGLPIYRNSSTTYFQCGKDFHRELLACLKRAEQFIFMEYFIIEEGVMWDPIYELLKEKANNGVKVYVIYDDFGCISTLAPNYYQKLVNEGINAMPSNKFKPVLSRIHNNRDHRKITVIDGVVGFTGGINLADEYINAKNKYGHWKDSAIKVEGDAVLSLTALFLETWNTQNKPALNVQQFLKVRSSASNAEGIVAVYGDGPEDFYADNIGKSVYLNMLNAAKKYVYITTPYLICDYEIINALCLCAKKGVDVRIITPHIPDKKLIFWMTQSNYQVLIQNGVKIYQYTPGFIHAKNFICDDLYATCSTVNLDYRSLVHHFECGLWLYNCNSVLQMKKDYLATIEISQTVNNETAQLKGWKRLIAEVLKVFSPLM
ncbi:MAG: cardiolipin synthase [Erysipelotrichaceae bacterium]